jgi:hypothetical protein
VKTDADSDTFIHVSLRVPERLRNQLKEEADDRNITLNSLINTIISMYISYNKILEVSDAMSFSGAFFQEWLEITSADQMEGIAKKLGPKVVRQIFAFQGVDFNLDNLIRYYFEPLSANSRWYLFNIHFEGSSRKLIFRHSHGPKWTAYLKPYYAAIIRSATGVEPGVTVEDGVLTFTCR